MTTPDPPRSHWQRVRLRCPTKVEADEIRRLTADLEAIFHRLPFRDATLSDRLVRGLRQAGFELADPPATGG